MDLLGVDLDRIASLPTALRNPRAGLTPLVEAEASTLPSLESARDWTFASMPANGLGAS